jgi:hypothetical protein
LALWASLIIGNTFAAVGGGKQRRRHGEALQLGGLGVYDQLELLACTTVKSASYWPTLSRSRRS